MARPVKVFASAILSVAMLALPGTAGGHARSPVQQRTTLRLALGTPAVMPYYIFYVAMSKGYFAKQGLHVSIRIFDGNSAAAQALAAGKADIADTSSTDILRGPGTGFEPVLFFQAWYGEPVALYVPASSGVRKAADLRGKTVGVQDVTAVDAQVARTLASQAKLKEGVDYGLVGVGDAEQAVTALQRGEIQAVVAGIRDAAIIRSRGVDLRPIKPDRPSSLLGLWAKRKLLQGKPEAVLAFVRALRSSYNLIGNNHYALMNWTKAYDPSQLPPGAMGVGLARTSLNLRRAPRGLLWGRFEARVFDSWFARAKAAGEIKAPGKPSDYYTLGFYLGKRKQK